MNFQQKSPERWDGRGSQKFATHNTKITPKTRKLPAFGRQLLEQIAQGFELVSVAAFVGFELHSAIASPPNIGRICIAGSSEVSQLNLSLCRDAMVVIHASNSDWQRARSIAIAAVNFGARGTAATFYETGFHGPEIVAHFGLTGVCEVPQ